MRNRPHTHSAQLKKDKVKRWKKMVQDNAHAQKDINIFWSKRGTNKIIICFEYDVQSVTHCFFFFFVNLNWPSQQLVKMFFCICMHHYFFWFDQIKKDYDNSFFNKEIYTLFCRNFNKILYLIIKNSNIEMIKMFIVLYEIIYYMFFSVI